MQIINLDKWCGTYAEIGQTNPMRWQNLKLVEPGVYTPVSNKWKCKDFMNEVVTSYHTGRDFSIYSFSVKHSEFFNHDELDLPILLHNVLPGFKDNIETVNNILLEEGLPAIVAMPWEDKWFIEIPSYYLANTLFMSQVTLFIRLANTEELYESINDMCNDKVNKQDRPNLDACFKKPLKDFPEKLEPYLWYYNEESNLRRDVPKGTSIQTSLMHNCGVVNWGWM